MKKAILIGGAVIVIVVAAGLYYLVSNIDGLIKTAVEEIGSKATKAQVTLNEVNLSTEGRGTLRGLRVGNPSGFNTPSAFSLGEVSVSLDIASVTEDIVRIREILVVAPEVTYEWASAGSNLEVIKKNVEAFAGLAGGGGGPAKSGGDSAPATGDDSGPKIIIDKVTLRDGQVNVSAEFLGGKKMTVPLPNIELTDIGKKEGGTSAGDAVRQIMDKVTSAAGKAVTSLNIGRLTESAGQLLQGATGALQGTAGSAGETVKKSLGSTGESIKKGASEAAGTLKKLFGN